MKFFRTLFADKKALFAENATLKSRVDHLVVENKELLRKLARAERLQQASKPVAKPPSHTVGMRPLNQAAHDKKFLTQDLDRKLSKTLSKTPEAHRRPLATPSPAPAPSSSSDLLLGAALGYIASEAFTSRTDSAPDTSSSSSSNDISSGGGGNFGGGGASGSWDNDSSSAATSFGSE